LGLTDELRDFQQRQDEANSATRELIGIIRNSQRSDRYRIEALERSLRDGGDGRQPILERVLVLEQKIAVAEVSVRDLLQKFSFYVSDNKDIEKERIKGRTALLVAIITGVVGIITTVLAFLKLGAGS
jgi:hypothetical protein